MFSRDDLTNMYRALAHLYAYTRNFQRAVDIYLLLRDKTVFSVLNRFRVFPMFKDRIVKLMEIDKDLALRLLIENEDSMPIREVVEKLNSQPRSQVILLLGSLLSVPVDSLQMAYLNKMIAHGRGTEFADKLIHLYAQYDKEKLLPFLRKHTTYDFDAALKLCNEKKFLKEVTASSESITLFVLAECVPLGQDWQPATGTECYLE